MAVFDSVCQMLFLYLFLVVAVPLFVIFVVFMFTPQTDFVSSYLLNASFIYKKKKKIMGCFRDLKMEVLFYFS